MISLANANQFLLCGNHFDTSNFILEDLGIVGIFSRSYEIGIKRAFILLKHMIHTLSSILSTTCVIF